MNFGACTLSRISYRASFAHTRIEGRSSEDEIKLIRGVCEREPASRVLSLSAAMQMERHNAALFRAT